MGYQCHRNDFHAPLFLLTVEAQKKKLGKKKDAVFVELRAPHRAKGAF